MLKMDTRFMVGPRLFDNLDTDFFREESRFTIRSGLASRKMFPNGWGISVVCHGCHAFRTYGYDLDKPQFEIAVLSPGGLHYRNPITCDIVGYLSAQEVDEFMRQIAAWPTVAPEEDWERPERRYRNTWGLAAREPVPEPGYRSSAYNYTKDLLRQDY
jgi:hypothetical protein